jgi:hypothetical protein
MKFPETPAVIRNDSSNLVQLVATKEMNTAVNSEQYYVYANCNVTYCEDFTFLFTALFNWE